MVSISLTFVAQQLRQSLANVYAKPSFTRFLRATDPAKTIAHNVDEKDVGRRRATDRASAVDRKATAARNEMTFKEKHSVNGMDMLLRPNYVAPRNPIVLCHGLFGFDKMGFDSIPQLQIHYWSGIQEALVKLGARVIVTRVPRTGGIVERARELHRILEATMNGKDVNLLAHSMGGLDCRYLITHMPSRSYSVRTLTTVSTPHRGSPVMDWFRDHVGVGVVASIADAANKAAEEAGMREPQTSSMELERGKEAVRRVYDSEPRYHADGSRDAKSGNGASHKQDNSRTSSSFSLPFTLPSLPSLHLNPTTLLDPLLSRVVQTLDTPAYSNLTTDYCIGHFNPNTPDVSGVRYYSYGAATQIPIWSLLGFPWEVISEKEGPNDGLVSVRSARWGKYIETVDATHWDLNGSNNMWRVMGSKTNFDTVEFYLRVATFLHSEGF